MTNIQIPATNKERRFNWPRIFGYDFFISFKLGPPPIGAQSYASDLARRLRELDFTVFYSEEEAPPGERLDSTLVKALHHSRILVVVANEGALVQSKWVRKEVEEFRRKHPKRPVIPINIDQAIEKFGPQVDALTWLDPDGRIWLYETIKALDEGITGSEVLNRLKIVPRFMKANTRLRWMTGTIFLGLVGLASLAGWQWLEAERQAQRAIAGRLAMRTQNIPDEQYLTRLLVGTLATRYSHTSEADASLARELLPTVPLKTVLWSPHRGDPMTCISFSRDGTYVAGSNTHGVTVWHTATTKQQAFLPSEDGVDCVTFGPSDSLLAISDQGRVILWEWVADSRRLLGEEPDETQSTSAFSADGASVFVASKNKITKWDIRSDSARVLMNMNPSMNYGYAFSTDAKLLAYAAAEQQQITVWDIEAEKSVIELDRSPGKAGVRLAFSADGQTLAASGDHVLTVWDLRAGKSLPLNQLDDVVVKSFAFSPNGETIAIGGLKSDILQWDFRKRMQRWPLRGPGYGTQSIAFSPDGKIIASSGDNGSVLLWEPSKQHEHILEKHVEVELISEAISSDGRMLALKRGEGYLLWDPSGAKRPQKLFDYPGEQFRPTLIQFTRGGKLMAALDRDRGVALWNIDDGRQVKRFAIQESTPEYMDIGPNDAHVATVDIDGGIVGWNIETQAKWSKDAAMSGHARSLAFSLDGKMLASGGLEGDIHLWSADSGKLLIKLKNPERNVLALAFSPDGKRLAASAGSVIVIWNVKEKTIRRSLRGHHSSVTSLAFSSDGKLIASGSLDNRAILWDSFSGEVILVIGDNRNPSEVTGVALSGDGKTLATRNRGTSVKLWNIDVDRWTQIACSIVNRNLTLEEWETFLPGERYQSACPDLAVPPYELKATIASAGKETQP